MSVVVKCSCGQEMTADESWAGREVQCIRCGGMVPVPAAGAAVKTPAQKPAEPAPIPGAAASTPGAPAPTPGAAKPMPGPGGVEQDAALAATIPQTPALGIPVGPAAKAAAKPADAQGKPAEAEQGGAQPSGRPARGQPRYTYVADWAKDMAEEWAEDHGEHIASHEKPSRALLIVGGVLTVLVGLNFLASSGYALTRLIEAAVPGRRGMGMYHWATVVAILLSLATVVVGVMACMSKKAGADASMILGLLWVALGFLGVLTAVVVQREFIKENLLYVGILGGIWVVTCLATVFSGIGRKQAYAYQLWLTRQSMKKDEKK